MRHYLRNLSRFPLVLMVAFGMKADSQASPTVSLSGIVKDAEVPIGGARVFIEGDCEQPSATTDPQGRFTIPNVQTGRHLVAVYANSGAVSATKTVNLPDDQQPIEIDVKAVPPISLPGAIAGRPYLYQIAVSGPPEVRFRENSQINGWHGSPKGLVEGNPGPAVATPAAIDVEACAEAKTPLERVFLIPVQQTACPAADELAWCERDSIVPDLPLLTFRLVEQAPAPNQRLQDWAKSTQIIQFTRLYGPHGQFGALERARSKVEPADDAHNFPPVLTNSVNASQAPISGSILLEHGVARCPVYQWKVVTQSVDSSNILVYGPGEVNAYCDNDTLSIVLPVHAIWATVVGSHANTYDPTWKPLTAPPRGHECAGTDPLSPDGIPIQGIRPCDDLPTTRPPGVAYWSPVAWTYIRLTQPGATQGSISLAPRAISPKGSWDSQAYVSTRLGVGWLGLTTMYEHDHKAQNDLNSATGAITYDWRWGISPSFLFSRRPSPESKPKADPVVGLRAPEVTVRFGPEWSPGPAAVKQHKDDFGRDLNMVGAATLRLPIIFNGPAWWVFNRQPQPSMVTILPIAGTEEGFRVRWHDADEMTQSPEIRRYVAGVDASLRWPFNFTHNFLGNRPVTVDYSFRARFLAHDEPYIDTRSQSETLSGDWRIYSRVTLVLPASAYFQVRLALQRGALPPLFQSVGSFLTIGLTFSNPGSSEH